MERGPGSPYGTSHHGHRAAALPSRATAAIVAAVLLLPGLAPPSGHAAPLGKSSSSREDRSESIRQIPFDRLTPEARQRIAQVVQKPTLFRHMPDTMIDCDPQIYRFLVRYPEVVVNIWQLMGITRVTVDRVGPFTLNAQDGVGTITSIELVYGDQETHLLYCEGSYDGPLFPRPLTGRCVLLLKSDYKQTEDDRWQIGNQMDVFLQIDNIAVDVVTRTLHPLLGKSADVNFVQSAQFLERISRTSEENGSGMNRLAARLDNVRPDVRQQFAQLTGTIYANAQDRTAEAAVAQKHADAVPNGVHTE
jgi:hypothetical protein